LIAEAEAILQQCGITDPVEPPAESDEDANVEPPVLLPIGRDAT
jgi:hypothetical protein